MIGEMGDTLEGERLVAWGRKVMRVRVVSGSSSHRAQRVIIVGKPARCRIIKPWRFKR